MTNCKPLEMETFQLRAKSFASSLCSRPATKRVFGHTRPICANLESTVKRADGCVFRRGASLVAFQFPCSANSGPRSTPRAGPMFAGKYWRRGLAGAGENEHLFWPRQLSPRSDGRKGVAK